MNRYALWKYALLAGIVLLAFIYALPNLYGEDPALQISSSSLTRPKLIALKKDLIQDFKKISMPYKSIEIQTIGENSQLLIRFRDSYNQLKAQDWIKAKLGEDYNVALNLASLTPPFLTKLGAKPMKLGLDLRGGVHFLIALDLNSVIEGRLEANLNEARSELRLNKIRFLSARLVAKNNLQFIFKTAAEADSAYAILRTHSDLEWKKTSKEGHYQIEAKLSKFSEQAIKNGIVEQSIVILRNRINELGVSEAVVQRQGFEHVVVELPGIQDTARAKEILGKTATLEFLMQDTDHSLSDALRLVPAGSKIIYNKDGHPILLKKRVILSGAAITSAIAVSDPNGLPAVSVKVSGPALAVFKKVTRENIGKNMAVVFIEGRGNNTKKESLLSIATINSALGNNFQITGFKTAEAQNLALYLRAGSLPTNLSIVEERTVGPSLGQENIRLGIRSMTIGLGLVLVIMLIYYRVFGLLANIALCVNVILLVAALSLLGATLTLPGIAGIVLTVGMAVDANILIFERIREELRNGASAQSAIHSGFARAFSTILDSNLTTLIVGIVLFNMGSGAIKGFAITLSLGILTSLFSSVSITRALVNLLYGVHGREIKKLSVGI